MALPPAQHTEPLGGSLLQKLNPIVDAPPTGKVSLAGVGLNLRMSIIPNTRGTPGGSIRVVNNGPDAVGGVTVTILDLRPWDQELGKFVTVPDIHEQGTQFPWRSRAIRATTEAPETEYGK